MTTLDLWVDDLGVMLRAIDEKLATSKLIRRLLSRSRVAVAARDYYHWWADQLAVSSAEARLPIAALMCLGAGQTPGRWSLVASPVHLRADRDRVLLLATEQLQVTELEAKTLTSMLEDNYRDEHWVVRVMTPHCWCISLAQPAEVEFVPLAAAVGGDVYSLLPSGEQARLWRQRLNEIQMLLHDTQVNRVRTARGDLEINSVWFWGEGSLHSLSQCAKQALPFLVVSDDAFVRGLAAHCHYHSVPQVGNAHALLALANADSQAQGPQQMVCSIDLYPGEVSPANPAQILDEFLQHWLLPLCTAMKQGQLSALTLYSGQQAFQLRPGDLKSWWRRTRSLEKLWPLLSESPNIDR